MRTPNDTTQTGDRVVDGAAEHTPGGTPERIPERTPDRVPDRVPDLLIERLVADDLPADQARTVERRLAAEPGGENRLAALRASNVAILTALPAGAVAHEVERRRTLARARASAEAQAAHGPPRWLWWIGGPAVAAVAVALMLGRPTLPDEAGSVGARHAQLPAGALDDGAVDDTTRAKGLAPHLLVYRKRGEQIEQLQPGSVASPGDLVQLGYVAAGQSHGVIVSVDGRGAVTLHLPEGPADRPGEAGALEPDQEHRLARSYELDDAPVFERFFLVTSSQPFDIGVVVAAAKRLATDPQAAGGAPLDVPGGLRQASFLVGKEAK